MAKKAICSLVLFNILLRDLALGLKLTTTLDSHADVILHDTEGLFGNQHVLGDLDVGAHMSVLVTVGVATEIANRAPLDLDDGGGTSRDCIGRGVAGELLAADTLEDDTEVLKADLGHGIGNLLDTLEGSLDHGRVEVEHTVARGEEVLIHAKVVKVLHDVLGENGIDGHSNGVEVALGRVGDVLDAERGLGLEILIGGVTVEMVEIKVFLVLGVGESLETRIVEGEGDLVVGRGLVRLHDVAVLVVALVNNARVDNREPVVVGVRVVLLQVALDGGQGNREAEAVVGHLDRHLVDEVSAALGDRRVHRTLLVVVTLEDFLGGLLRVLELPDNVAALLAVGVDDEGLGGTVDFGHDLGDLEGRGEEGAGDGFTLLILIIILIVVKVIEVAGNGLGIAFAIVVAHELAARAVRHDVTDTESVTKERVVVVVASEQRVVRNSKV